jgi:long-chain acyl-CoA synthetase
MTPGGSLANLLAWRVAERPTYPFLYVEDEGPWMIGQLGAAASDLSTRLQAAGVEPGQRVVVRLPNDERFLAALVAVWLCQAAAVTMHPGAPPEELARVVTDMAASAVVADRDDGAKAASPATWVDLDRIDRATPNTQQLQVPDVSDDAEAIVLLTSGSTGRPKGVVLTHANAWSNLNATAAAFRRKPGPTPFPVDTKPPNLIANPFSHTGGLIRLLFALYVGRSLVVLRKFDARKAKAAVDTHGINHLTINPSMLRMLLDGLPDGQDLGAVRYVSSGTAPLSDTLRQEFEDRFGVPVLQAYGQTEAFGSIAIENVKDVLAGRRRPHSVGRPLPGVEVAISDDGEILVRSRSATAGYASKDDVDPSPIDAEGWLHTGDLGHFDDDGYLYVTGRIKNLIICGGFNIVPEEIEARLEGDPEVREATVVPLPDAKLGEIPVALVEATGDAEQILARAKDYLVSYKRPRRLFVVPELPRLANGKVDKGAARRMAVDLVAG